eukprot:TRINITY_DN2111_c0_g1_i1.p1 TRINITY_DN2111_c0_g1~~TRINITY_DN2111_c0_g1_i1.p1  ORF type:complete len:348 (-),score=93.28 TRINITY_DN2111_c0_g1_i1:32-1075(-)
MESGFESIAILEKDTNGDILITWSYPAIEESEKAVLRDRCQLSKEEIDTPFFFSRYRGHWQNFLVTSNPTPEGSALPRVVCFAVCIVSKVFDPERAQALAAILSAAYLRTGSPLKVMEGFLRVFTAGDYDGGKDGKFSLAQFDARRALLVSPLKTLIKTLGIETIIVWVGLLLKKRVVVYCDNLGRLVSLVRAMPLLVWHRQNWNILTPFVNINENELADLKPPYVVGSTDARIRGREDLFDVLVDVSGQRVTVSDAAKNDFSMGSFHKELASFLTTAADDDKIADQDLVRGLAQRVKKLLENLLSLAVEEDGQKKITLEILQQKKLANNMDRFLYNVALAENMTKS